MKHSTYLKIEKTQKGLHEKFTRLVNNELQWYENEATALFGKKRLPAVKDDQIIQQILPKSPNDEVKKITDTAYYAANAVVYLKVCLRLLTKKFIDRFDVKETLDDLVVYNYHRLFQGLLFDSLILLNEYCVHVKKQPAAYNLFKNPWQQNLTLYQSLRQSIFGQLSFHSFIEVEPDLSISIIRQLVELRVRRAFGVLGWYNQTSQSIDSLPMSVLFEEVAKYKNDIDLSMPLECLTRIYGWSNIFLHTGIKEYSWKPLFVTEYMKEFCLGKQNRYNVNGGVVVTKSVLEKIITSLEARHPAGADVIRCTPEAIVKDA